MKHLKKISLAYALQIFAVIFLFGYAVKSPVHQSPEQIPGTITPLKINRGSINPAQDSSSSAKTLWNVYTANSLK